MALPIKPACANCGEAYYKHYPSAYSDYTFCDQDKRPERRYQEWGVTLPAPVPKTISEEELTAALRKAHPHGHPEFIPLLVKMSKLHSDKNHDYASGGRPLGNFEREAALFKLYPGLDLGDPVVVALVNMMKQLDAALWGFSAGIKQKIEGPIERLSDVMVYAGIAICALKERDGTPKPQ